MALTSRKMNSAEFNVFIEWLQPYMYEHLEPGCYGEDELIEETLKVFRGKLAKDECGRYGRITDLRNILWGEKGWCFIGIGLDGEHWDSHEPDFKVVEEGPGLDGAR